ncbi:DUF397 domain-containing protein [Jidongwangia harbinensis]|uniref:DUF397 domain-containing protein n=1 Tax=Jidongwangia harbinensis TaxID=2878561 RepID=UPI001CD98F01|nr:DUF397 domain-containing protein [Jidongwangia harbinensis]MCA2214537.1 DUF397 domain-containing protein [Jidongwangia harbinensis]
MTKSVEQAEWRRSCGNSSCVEVAKIDDRYLIRDSKNPDVPPLEFTSNEWEAFTAGIARGDFHFE